MADLDHSLEEIPLSVREVSQLVKERIEGEFRSLFVTGEVQNLTFSASGHYYFNLHGQDCALSCVLFKQHTRDLPSLNSLQNGTLVWVWGDLGYYTKRGQLQFILKKLKWGDKEGMLKIRLEQLKQKFLSKGYFEISRKRPLPAHPKRIAIVSGAGTAAVRDFIAVYSRRSFYYSLLVFPALVQGEAAVDSLVAALERVKRTKEIDLVVVTRGGGSLEDLWCFNDERLIEYLVNFPLPFVSAIGHERDHTLIDLIADKSCETPSAAAEFLSQNSFIQLQQLSSFRRTLYHHGQSLVQFYGELKQRYSTGRLVSLLQQRLQWEKSHLQQKVQRMQHGLQNVWQMHRYRLEESPRAMMSALKLLMQKSHHQLEHFFVWLKANNPKSIMEKGYCLVWNKQGHLIDRASKLSSQQDVASLEFFDGKKEFSN